MNLTARGQAMLVGGALLLTLIVILFMRTLDYLSPHMNIIAGVVVGILALLLIFLVYGAYHKSRRPAIENRVIERESKARVQQIQIEANQSKEVEQTRAQLDLVEAHTRYIEAQRIAANEALMREIVADAVRRGQTVKFGQMHIEAPAQRMLEAAGEKESNVVDQAPPQAPAPMDLDRVDWMPSENELFLAVAIDHLIRLPITKCSHIWLGGPTGVGKSNLLRLLMAQLVKYHRVYLVNPHYAPVKPVRGDEPEDWRPIETLLAAPPAVTPESIDAMLSWGVEEINRRGRRERAEDFGWLDEIIYIAIDEWPVVVKWCPRASEYVGEIKRRGRHYGVCIINTSQSGLVSTNDETSGDQNQYGVIFNLGIESQPANRLKVKIKEVNDDQLGKAGLVIVRAGKNPAELARIPHVRNAVIYRWLGFGNPSESYHLSEVSGSISGNSRNDFRQPEKTTDGNISVFPMEGQNVKKIVRIVPSESEKAEVLNLYVFEGLTRTKIQQRLGWGGDKYQNIIKPICDEYDANQERERAGEGQL